MRSTFFYVTTFHGGISMTNFFFPWVNKKKLFPISCSSYSPLSWTKKKTTRILRRFCLFHKKKTIKNLTIVQIKYKFQFFIVKSTKNIVWKIIIKLSSYRKMRWFSNFHLHWWQFKFRSTLTSLNSHNYDYSNLSRTL